MLFATCLALVWALSWASATYAEITGRPQSVRGRRGAFEIWFFFFSSSPIGPGPSKD